MENRHSPDSPERDDISLLTSVPQASPPERRAGGENGFSDADYLLLPVISLQTGKNREEG